MRVKNAVASIGRDSGTAVSVRRASGARSLQWSTAQTPMVLVRNAAGEVIGIGRTGDLDTSQFASATNSAGDVELLLTDGVTSASRRQSTNGSDATMTANVRAVLRLSVAAVACTANRETQRRA